MSGPANSLTAPAVPRVTLFPLLGAPKKLVEAIELQRANMREAFKRAVLAEYIVDAADAEGPGRFVTRRLDVYRTVAVTLRTRLLTPPFCQEVQQVVVNLGAIKTRVGNRALFRGMYRREICPAQAGVESSQMRARARGTSSSRGTKGRSGSNATPDYMAMLEAEGMPAELAAVNLVDPQRAALNDNRIGKATAAFWKLDKEHAVLRAYMGGAAIRDIVEMTGIGKHAVHRILHRHGLTNSEGGDV